MRQTRLTLACAALAVLLGCGGDPAPGLSLSDGSATFERLGPWHYTGLDAPRRAVIATAAAWHTAWQELFARQTPAPELPAVDFDTDVVVLVAMGTRASGGYGIAVDDVARADGVIRVRVTETAPGSGCGVTLALTQPADAVIVRGGQGYAVQFVERESVRSCD
jgi:hypothetical protein